jgi:hypothetical protein
MLIFRRKEHECPLSRRCRKGFDFLTANMASFFAAPLLRAHWTIQFFALLSPVARNRDQLKNYVHAEKEGINAP